MKWLLTALLLTNMTAFAGDKGNGGDGIEIDGKLYVLDLVEAGVETKPYFNALISGPLTEYRLKELFSDESYPRTLISHKLAEIREIAPVFADMILQTMEAYQWKLVNGALVNIKDEDTVLQYENLKQLAVRKNGSIFINKSLWAQLDPENKTALIFHEVLYALIKPKMVGGKLQQVSDRAREVTGYLFTDRLSKGWKEGLKKFLRSDYFDLATDYMANSSPVMGAGGSYSAFQPKIRVRVGNKYFAFGVSQYIPKPEDFQIEEICKIANTSVYGRTVQIMDAYSKLFVELKEFSTEDGTRNYVEVRAEMLDEQSSSNESVTDLVFLEAETDPKACVAQVKKAVHDKIDIVKAKYDSFEDESIEDDQE